MLFCLVPCRYLGGEGERKRGVERKVEEGEKVIEERRRGEEKREERKEERMEEKREERS
jgi:hypothetical protein